MFLSIDALILVTEYICLKSEKIKETIADAYYDKAGYGSVYSTYKEAKAKNKLIKLEDVKDWFERNIERKTHLRGYNSYVSKGPRDEFEVDLFDVHYLGQKEFIYGSLAIDNFTKCMWVIPIASKDGDELIRAMKGIVGNMGKPKKFTAIKSLHLLEISFRNG